MIIVVEGDVRKLIIGDKVISGGNNRAGLYAYSDKIYFDGNLIATSNQNRAGLYAVGDKVFFNGAELTGGKPPVIKYWNPPIQSASTYRTKDYAGYIADYDALMAQYPTYITKHRYEKDGVPVRTMNGNYELFSYRLTPITYSKTIFIQAGIHGNEMDAKQQLLRLVDIICNKTNEAAYSALAPLRNDVRFIIIPIVSPYGHDNASMNVPYPDAQYGINLNRNYDANHQYALPSVGVGGNSAFDMAEVQHTRDIIEEIGAYNIDYLQDWHDGGNVDQHYWLNYSVDGDNRELVMDFVNYLVDKYKIENPIIPNCKDTGSTGTAQMWGAKTMGLMASTVEWIGGLLGYDFGSSQMTQSMEIRANMVLLAYKNDIKGWKIPYNGSFFEFNYPCAFTRHDLRLEGAGNETKVTDTMIYDRWDRLRDKYPNRITKSERLGFDCTGTLPIHTYTIGSGSKKVLYVGGVLRYGATHKIDEYAIYLIVEYLCNDYIVNQSPNLQDLRDNYTIIVLPFIDNTAANAVNYRDAGLNNAALSRGRWQIINDICVPASGINGEGNHGIIIIKNIINNNQDIKCIVSGGEIMTGYAGNNQTEYSTDYEMQIIIPRKMTFHFNELKKWLEDYRNEHLIIENTQGATFGDYAFDNFGIRTYYIQQKVSKKYLELSDYHTLTVNQYQHGNYETGRRISNIINLFIINNNSI